MLFKQFKLIPFLAGIVAGFAALHFVKRDKVVVHDYPHPDNVKQRVYRDKNGVCYAYTSIEVDCDKNEATLKPYPLQG
jgi:hypothetical protein